MGKNVKSKPREVGILKLSRMRMKTLQWRIPELRGHNRVWKNTALTWCNGSTASTGSSGHLIYLQTFFNRINCMVAEVISQGSTCAGVRKDNCKEAKVAQTWTQWRGLHRVNQARRWPCGGHSPGSTCSGVWKDNCKEAVCINHSKLSSLLISLPFGYLKRNHHNPATRIPSMSLHLLPWVGTLLLRCDSVHYNCNSSFRWNSLLFGKLLPVHYNYFFGYSSLLFVILLHVHYNSTFATILFSL